MFCKKCSEFTYEDTCHCKPYQVFNPDTMDEGDCLTIYAKCKQSAAEKYIQKDYHEDHCKTSDYRVVFFIDKTRYEGTVHIELSYYAEEF